MWSGRVNAILKEIAGALDPGTALDLGCGEGADVIWLAERGWIATGIDISPTAIQRAREAARASRIPDDRARFVVGDLVAPHDDTRYDLVAASFLHSPVQLPRTAILRAAATRVASAGQLLVTSHAALPPWAHPAAATEAPQFLSPEEEIEQLELDANDWATILAESRPREAVGPDGTPATLEDAIVLVRRK